MCMLVCIAMTPMSIKIKRCVIDGEKSKFDFNKYNENNEIFSIKQNSFCMMIFVSTFVKIIIVLPARNAKTLNSRPNRLRRVHKGQKAFCQVNISHNIRLGQ